MFADRLKKSLLQAAIQGHLTEQLPTDGDARDLLRKIRAEKTKLIATKKIKAEKPLPPVTDDEIPFDIPDSWCWVRLGELCEYIQRGKSPQYSQIKKYPVVAQKCNQPWGFTMEQAKFIDPDTIASYGKERFLQVDDLLWNSTGLGTVGRVAIYDPLKNPYELAVADSHVTVIRLFKNSVLSRFVFSYIKSSAVQSKMDSMVSGSTKQKELATETVRNLVVPLPPFAEQTRIVEKLDVLLSEVDELAKDEHELIALEETFPRRMRNSLLQAAIQGKLTEQLPTDGDARDLLKKIRAEKAKLFAEKKIKAEKTSPPVTDDEIPFDLPDNWCWCRLGDVCEMYTGNSIAESEKKAKYLGLTDGFSYIGTKDISFDSRINYDNGVRIPFENNFRRAKKNSILMCIEGGSAGRKIAITDRDVCFGNKLCNFNAEKISNRYIYFYLQSSAFKKFFVDNVTGIIGGVSLKRLNLIPFPLPPLDEQKRIVERLEKFLPLCETEI